MKLPDSVQIGPYTLRVSREVTQMQSGDLGACRPSDGLMVVRPDISPQETVMTFLHEVCHMYTVLWAGDLDEARATRMSGFLYEFLRDNPGIVELVRKAESESGGRT